MATYRGLSGETIYDIAVKLYRDLPLGVSDILRLNPDINLDSDLHGIEVTYTEGLTRKKPVFTTETAIPAPIYYTHTRQTVYDLAIQLQGDFSKIGNFIRLFPNLDSEINLAEPVENAVSDDPIAQFFSDRGIVICTDIGIQPLTVDTTQITVDSTTIFSDATIR